MRLDLETGKLDRDGFPDVLLQQIGKAVFYISGERKPEPSAIKGVEIGRFDTKTGVAAKLAVIETENFWNLAGSSDGDRLILMTEGTGPEPVNQKTAKLIVLDGQAKVLKEIPLPMKDSSFVAMGPDPATAWFVMKDGREGTGGSNNYSLQECRINEGTVKTLFEFESASTEWNPPMPAVSPDGKFLALSCFYMAGDADSVLYLVDLTTTDRKVTKILVPAKVAVPEK